MNMPVINMPNDLSVISASRPKMSIPHGKLPLFIKPNNENTRPKYSGFFFLNKTHHQRVARGNKKTDKPQTPAKGAMFKA